MEWCSLNQPDFPAKYTPSARDIAFADRQPQADTAVTVCQYWLQLGEMLKNFLVDFRGNTDFCILSLKMAIMRPIVLKFWRI